MATLECDVLILITAAICVLVKTIKNYNTTVSHITEAGIYQGKMKNLDTNNCFVSRTLQLFHMNTSLAQFKSLYNMWIEI